MDGARIQEGQLSHVQDDGLSRTMIPSIPSWRSWTVAKSSSPRSRRFPAGVTSTWK